MGKTQLGRVVYDRKTHFFTYADIVRIARKIDPRETKEDGIEELENIFWALDALLYDLDTQLNLIVRKEIFETLLTPFILRAMGHIIKWITVYVPRVILQIWDIVAALKRDLFPPRRGRIRKTIIEEEEKARVKD